MNNKRIRTGKFHSPATKVGAGALSIRSGADRMTDDKSHDVFTAQDFVLMMREFKRKQDMPTPDRNAPRKAMVVALPLSLIAALKKRSYEESIRLGWRVTQQELAESALRVYLYEQ
jgi:hypothetical protein